ncbi:MAG: tRNA 2-thiouridine(34) synthase MnmA [Clostridiales bacterium]|nr:tRNA 2-thiouridine(34) synthase MnmA [Clostridiales bacterium]
MTRALIAMSGGVDSSLAAKIMSERGYDCVGCTMKLFSNEDIEGKEEPSDTSGTDRASDSISGAVKEPRTCCSLDDVEDARSVCMHLGIPYHVFNFKDEFREKVIGKFVDCYEHGRTPNPCIDCNRYLKFGKLYERAQILGCDVIVTGHYARIEERDGVFHLRKALDESKDQSYVLYALTQEQLAHTVFPLGDLKKTEVREQAKDAGMINASKRESQDICFVPDGDYVSFLRRYTGHEYPSGDFVDKEGHVLGTHKGIVAYTPGQRRGLGLALPAPMYVSRLDVENNRVILVYEEDLKANETIVDDVNWISGVVPAEPLRVQAKVRYRQKEQWATVYPLPEDEDPVTDDSGTRVKRNRVRLVFDEPLRAITPGQAAVFYDGDEVLGGGTILE